MNIKNVFLWIAIVGMILTLSSVSYALVPVSISHSLISYTSNGPTVSIDLSLNITNNGTLGLFNAEITVAPLGPLADRLLLPLPEQSSLYIGNLPGSGKVSVTYTLQSISLLPEEMIKSLPLYFEIKYTDENGQTQLLIAESQPASGS